MYFLFQIERFLTDHLSVAEESEAISAGRHYLLYVPIYCDRSVLTIIFYLFLDGILQILVLIREASRGESGAGRSGDALRL